MLETDFLIIGAGIAGASIAYRLAPEANVILVDMEAQADYHTTGRSAAFYAETYGGPAVQPLTTASKEFLSSPPEGFTAYPLMHELGALHVFRTGQESQAQQLFASLHQSLPDVVMLDRNQVLGKAPQLAPSDIAGGVFDPGCSGLDVAVLHQAFLRAAKKAGAKMRLNAMLKGAEFVRGLWRVETTDTVISAKVLVNTAGAWADKVAELCGIKPLGLQPLRRTIVTVDTPDGHIRAAQSPIIMEIGKEHYFKPEGQGYLLTPGDEILMPPSDVQPELEDVALAIEQFEQATKLSVKKIGAKWAGLRTRSNK